VDTALRTCGRAGRGVPATTGARGVVSRRRRARGLERVEEQPQELVRRARGRERVEEQPQELSQTVAARSVRSRLLVSTRAAVRAALPHTYGLVTLLNAADSSTIAVCLPDEWTAHVSLDSLQVANAVLRVRRVVLQVASDLDAPSNPPQAPRPFLSTDQHALLCRMADDRLAAAESAVPPAPSAVHRNAVMLCALRDLLTYEICAPLILGNLWAQAGVLASSNWAPGLAVVVMARRMAATSIALKLPKTIPLEYLQVWPILRIERIPLQSYLLR
jgi:hypothetical protein